jgi:4-hydroxy-3-polyprenylbenzoate decarboxylase
MNDLVLAITGASGSAYAVRLLEVLIAAGRRVHLVISQAGVEVIRHELGLTVDLRNFTIEQLLRPAGELDSRLGTVARPVSVEEFALSSVLGEGDARTGEVLFHDIRDFSAGIASGSFPTAGMVICPCSMGTLAAIAHGMSTNLIQRAADVHLKERRRLIVVPRETPLGSIQLDNMKRLSDAGATILPAMPGFYHSPRTIHDLVDFVVCRICDQLGINQHLASRWGASPDELPG